jgi:hypothetical protein
MGDPGLRERNEVGLPAGIGAGELAGPVEAVVGGCERREMRIGAELDLVAERPADYVA